MRSMTTAAIVLCPELPLSGLRQSMHNPTIPLRLEDILDAPSISGEDGGIGLNITRSLISDAIKRIHTDGVDSIFGDSDRYPNMPSIHCLNTSQTKFWQFGAIFEDEGTIEGTYGVHKSIFLDQLGLQTPENPIEAGAAHDDFRDRLWLVHGDQLTAHHIRAVKNEQTQARRPYDRRDWLLGIPAWFHIQMNLLNTIVRTHWAPVLSKEEAHHCLRADTTMWGRNQCSRENARYHLMEPIVAQGFTARVVALFYAAMQRRGYLIASNRDFFERMDHITDAISPLTPDQFLELVEDVRLAAFTLDAWNGNGPDKQPHNDIEFRTMCRMLQEVELFLSIRHAVKHADIGMLRRFIDPLIIYFFGASQYNYGREMLFYRWNLSPVNTPELQHAILSSGLVNWLGRATTHKAIDLGLEHLNGSCKIEMKCYKNSTHDVDITFDRVCLSNTWARALRKKVEATFGEHMPGTHTTAAALPDMFLLARTVFTSDLAEPRSTEQLTGMRFFDSYNILQKGIEVLADKVDQFNQQHVRQLDTVQGAYPSGNLDDVNGFANIEDYVDQVGERLDGVIDPTIDLTTIDLTTIDTAD